MRALGGAGWDYGIKRRDEAERHFGKWVRSGWGVQVALSDGGGLNVLSASNVDARQAEEGSRAAFHIERTSNYKMTTYHGTSRAELWAG